MGSRIGGLAILLAAASGSLNGQGSPANREIFRWSADGGALPATARVLSGAVAVAAKDGIRMLKAATPTEILVTLPETLPLDFTIAVDFVPKSCCNPEEDLGLEGTATRARTSASAQILWHRVRQQVAGGGADYEADTPPDLRESTPGQLTHVVVSVEGTTVKLYTNGKRLYTLTDRRFARGNVLRVFLGGRNDADQAVYLAGLRVLAGGSTGTVAAGGSTVTTIASNAQASTAAATEMTGLTVTTDAQGRASVRWDPVADATGYVLLRWHLSDLGCCNAVSPPGAISGTTWQDGVLPKQGTYGYRVYATTAAGVVMGETRLAFAGGVSSSTPTITAAGSGVIQSTAPAPPPLAPAPMTAVTTIVPATATATATPMPPPAPAPAPPPPGTQYAVTTTTLTGATATPIGTVVPNATAVYTGSTTVKLTWSLPATIQQHSPYSLVIDRWTSEEDGAGCLTEPHVYTDEYWIVVDQSRCKRWLQLYSTALTWEDKWAWRTAGYYYHVWLYQYGRWYRSSAVTPGVELAKAPVAGPGGTTPTVLSGGPAPVLAPIAGTVSEARLSWSAPAGAVTYRVLRRVANYASEQRTPTPISTTTFTDAVTDPRATHEYQILAYQSDGRFGASAWVSYRPAPMKNPEGFTGRVAGDGQIRLEWNPVPDAAVYRVDGAGLPATGREVEGKSLVVSGVPGGRQEWRVAAVYPGHLMDLATRPVVTLTLPAGPWRATPFLTMNNGAGSQTASESYWRLLGDNCSGGAWACGHPINQISNTAQGAPVFGALFADVIGLGAGRRVWCKQAGLPPATETVCWASTHGPALSEPTSRDPQTLLAAAMGGNPDRGWTVIKQGAKGFQFRAYNGRSPIGTGYVTGASAYDPDLWGTAKTSVAFDTEGPKFLPHSCLACHGGKYDALLNTVIGATLLPIDPSLMVFPSESPTRAEQEESIRQINQIVLNATGNAAVAQYIRGMYNGAPAAAGTKANDAFVPAGWVTAPDLFRNVVKPYCYGCHMAQTERNNFATRDNFMLLKESIKSHVCTLRSMPHSESAFRAFWQAGGSVSLPEYLMTSIGMEPCIP